jgi:hypothetical protein
MGVFGTTNSDRLRLAWHLLNARLNGYTLHLPEITSICQSYFSFEDNEGITHICVFNSDYNCEKEHKRCQKDKNYTKIYGLRLSSEEVDNYASLISRVVEVEIERRSNNIKYGQIYGKLGTYGIILPSQQ